VESIEFEAVEHEEVQADLRAMFRGAIRMTLETLLEEEIRELVGAGRWQRMVGRKDRRNGSYLRKMITSMGLMEVTVPRARETGSAAGVLGRYKRRSSELDDAITSAYVQGVSTRKMRKVTTALMGEGVSRSTVSRVTKTLEEKVESLRSAPLTQEFPYVYLDATFLDARWARTVENVSALVAYGVGADGHRHLLAITIGPSESEASWADLLRQLLERGLRGVRLVIADGHTGLAAAARKALPEAKLQRCTVHLTRNVLAKAPWRPPVSEELTGLLIS
jgi:transposase-like protein